MWCVVFWVVVFGGRWGGEWIGDKRLVLALGSEEIGEEGEDEDEDEADYQAGAVREGGVSERALL